MSARFDTEVMEHLDKLYRQHVINESARTARGASARMSLGESAAFASPGQNAVAMFRESVSTPLSESNSDDFDLLSQSLTDDVSEDFPGEKILQPRRLSLRVF